MKKNPHYDNSQERIIHTNPYRTSRDVSENDKSVEVQTQDVKSNEVNTDEPKKRRKSRKESESTNTSSEQSDSQD